MAIPVRKLIARFAAAVATMTLMAAGAVALATAATAAPLDGEPVDRDLVGPITAWGYDLVGQATVPAELDHTAFLAVSAGDWHTVGLKTDGTVAAWGWDRYGITDVPAGLTDVVAVSAGGNYTMALKSNGTVTTWGDNKFGQTDISAGLSDAIAVSAGGTYSLALKSDGTVIARGLNELGQTDVPAGLIDVVAISAGENHSLALKSNGTVVAWGQDTYGATNVPAGLSDVVAVAAGDFHSLALKSNGTVTAWGNNDEGQTDVPAGLRDVVAVAAARFHSLALKSDGTVVAWGDSENGQLDIPAKLTDVVAISAGGQHNAVIRDESRQPFPDVSSETNVHWKNIAWLKHQGITKPIGGKYMPKNAVNRGAMATFLYRLANPQQEVPSCTKKPFKDVATDYVHCGAIQWAVNNGITVGYPDGDYKPTNTVTRGSMATFLYRVAGSPATPACTSKPFGDVSADYVHCKTIRWAKDNGITTGLSGGQNYGPDQVVNRDQMASFLRRMHDYIN